MAGESVCLACDTPSRTMSGVIWYTKNGMIAESMPFLKMAQLIVIVGRGETEWDYVEYQTRRRSREFWSFLELVVRYAAGHAETPPRI